MKKYHKYILTIAFLISVSYFLFGISARTSLVRSTHSQSINNLTADDSLPKFPVKKTHIQTYEDLNVQTPIDLKSPSNIQTKIEYDPKTKLYIIRTLIGDNEIATPLSLSSNEYMEHTLKQSMADYFKKQNSLLEQENKKSKEFSLKDVKINIGPAERLFGPGGVQLKANGYVEAVMGVKSTSINNPTLSERNRKKTNFYFDEDIQVNMTASVGDRVSFDMNYDTKSMFDFDSKKIKLAYEGEEDEIIKHLSAGNVSMTTSNSLINGGSALFGISTELQFGKLRVNAVLSQQEAESRTIGAKGGVQVNNYEFKADAYDENKHFFIGHYFRDHYDQAMSKLPFVQSPINITRLEVWITNKRGDYTQARNMVGFADIGEYDKIKNTSKWQKQGTVKAPYNNANNLHTTIINTTGIRDISQVTSLLTTQQLVAGLDYEKIESARLLNSSEYTFNTQLGYVSLNSALQADEVLAVAYEYKMNGTNYKVGEFAADIVDKYQPGNEKSGALLLKLIKPVSLSPRSYTWHLMMKNVYSIGANGIQEDKFRLNISYQSDTLGTYINYLSEGNRKNEMLIKVLNMDRLDARKNTNPDGIYDYVEGYTVNSNSGRIYFPVVEPFGKHLAKEIGNTAIAEKYVYQQLYDSTKTVAQQIAEKNKFKIYGSYRGSASGSDIMLNATNVAPGSVRVTAGGTALVEGTDYIVDYMSGVVTIINQNILDSDIPVSVSLEDRTFSMQRKTMMGLNLSYDISKNFNVGGTIMHLYEKPLTTKAEIGNESLENTLWGFNTSFKKESMWLTNLVDKIPFVDATKPSQVSFDGEFAHLIAGHYKNKEVGAYSYLDDFETSQSRIDIKSPYAWTLASTPAENDLNKALFPEGILSNDLRYGMRRAHMAWFMIDGLFTRRSSSLTPQHIKNDKEQLSNHFVREVYVREIYPNKDVSFNESSTLPVLNLSYYPEQRGPYNVDAVNVNSDGKLLDPQSRWGGITRRMDVTDFETSNIEYVEFWMMDPFVYNYSASNPNKGGEFYINLGEISEDVLKDGKKFYENGLPLNDDPSAYEYTKWGKVPTRQSTVYAFNDDQGAAGRKKQDVGLNGLSTEEEFAFDTYANYVRDFTGKLSPTAIDELGRDLFSPLNDPAGDTYHHFRGSDYDSEERSILDRYKYYNGTEGNSPADNGEKFSTSARAVPDVEDINQDNTLNETEAYFQYRIDLKPDSMQVGRNHIVDSREITLKLANGKDATVTWYQFKVPIRKHERKVGNIQDFKSIRFMRMFMTGFNQETFLRFGTLQLVRGDWRTYEQSLNKENKPTGTGTLDISTVNIEENGDKKPVNYVLPPGLKRVLDPDQTQLTKENEQSLAIKVLELESGDARAVYKNTFYDLRRYKRIQLFTHAEELLSSDRIANGEITVFIRLGSDYKNNYYEYEIPMTITAPGYYSNNNNSDRELVWPKGNMFDFPLDVLKNTKLQRNKKMREGEPDIKYTTLYSNYDPSKPTNRISVMGNPSLSEVGVIMIGVRNNSRSNKSAEVWVNELRLTDFDDQGGWAAQGSLNLALSDLGTVTLTGRKETVGFGGLDQSLMERRMSDYDAYSIATNVDIGRFLPEKAKLSIPFFYSYAKEMTTPEYDPFDQDVKLKESLSIMKTKAERDSIKSLAQEKTITKSISFNNIKLNIKSKTPMPYDPANFTFGYTFSQSTFNSPATAYDVSQNYKGQMNYSYSPMMKSWEPFKALKGKKGADKFWRSMKFNYLPSNVAFNSVISRHYTETLTRDIESYGVGESNKNTFLSWSQSFYWDRDFNINWDVTQNLKLTFQSGTKAEIEEPYLQVNKKLNRDDYEIWRDSVWRSILRLGTPLEYRQTANVSYQLPFRAIPAMDWVTSNVNYSSAYNWDRGAKIEDLEIGNVINNSFTIDFNNRLNMLSLYNKSTYLKKINDRFTGRSDRQQRQSPRQQQQERKEQEARQRFTQKVQLKEDEKIKLTHNLKTKNIEVLAKKDGKPYRLKIKKIDENTIEINNKDTVNIEVNIFNKTMTPANQFWSEVGAYSARAMMSIRSVGINYSRRKETHISGYRPRVSNAFGQRDSQHGMAPGLGFAFGFEGGEDFVQKAYDRDWLIIDSMNINPAIYNNMEKLELRMELEPINGWKITLNAGREKNDRTELQYMYPGMPRTLGGSFSMTTISLSSAFKKSKAKNDYQSKIFDKFLANRHIVKSRIENSFDGQRYPVGGFMDEPSNAALAGTLYNPSVADVNLNSGDVLIPAFIAAYTGKNANKVKLSAFPSLLAMLPNWSMSYDGLSKIAGIKNYFKSIRLNHAYKSIYQVSNFGSHSDWLESKDDFGFIRDVLNGNPTPSSPFNIASVGITEAFNPLFGVEGTLNNNMSINGQFNNMRSVNLNMSSYQIIETLTEEWVIGFGYRIDQFNRLIGLSAGTAKDFNNDMNIKAEISNKINSALIRKIEEQFTQATSGTTITTLKFSADYTVSRYFTVRAFYDRIMNKPLISSNGYPTTNSNFGISMKFMLIP